MDLQVGVKVLLKNAEGKFLLMRRSADKYKGVGAKWDIPGGRIDVETSLMENLAREVREETGLELQGEPNLIAAQDIFARDIDKHIVRLTYVGEATGEIHLSEEHTESNWFALNELRAMGDVDVLLIKLLEDGIIS